MPERLARDARRPQASHHHPEPAARLASSARRALPGVTGQSWHNHAHDLAGEVGDASLLVAPLLLARRFRGDPQWEALRLPAVATTIGSAMLLGLFWSGTMARWGGVIQRVIATFPLGMMAALAVKLLSQEPQAAGPANRPTAS